MAVNGKNRRAYKGAPVSNSLDTAGLTTSGTSINFPAAMSGWPTGTDPFFIVIDPGTTKEEKVCVIYNTTTSLTVVSPASPHSATPSTAGRGIDDTTPKSHDFGAVVYPVFTALEANQANELVSKYANAGSVVYQGTGAPGTFTELAIGTANQVLSVNSGATAPAWGKVVDANVSDTAAIALSKLATGALPSGITVASANITDLAVATGDIADGAVTLAKTGTGVVGLTRVYSGSFTSQASFAIDNVFTSAYRHYKIHFQAAVSSQVAGGRTVAFRMRSGGTSTSISGTGYSLQTRLATLDTVPSQTISDNYFYDTASFNLRTYTSDFYVAWLPTIDIDLRNPAISGVHTTFTGKGERGYPVPYFTDYTYAGVMTSTTSYDGILFFSCLSSTVEDGVFSGTVTIYGWN